jgi:hypothetical protein
MFNKRDLRKLDIYPYEDDERRLKRLSETNFSSGIIPSVTLLSSLVKFLNETKTARGKKIVGILQKLVEIDVMTRPIPPEEPIGAAVELKRTNPKRYELQWDIAVRHELLRLELSEYQFTPKAFVFMGGGGKSPSQWSVAWKGDPKCEEGLALTPTEALDWILKLTQLGDVSRFRHCPQCQKWLFARSFSQTFCSTKCQQKNYSQSDKWKAYRRGYMRRYYKKNFSKQR